jgi:hypothetical protein
MKPPTTGNRTAYNNFTVNVLEHGARGNGTTDDTPYFVDALDRLSANGGEVYVPPGTYRLDTVIELASGQSLRLERGAVLRRVAAASSTDPVVRLRENNAALLGEGTVQSEKASPRGVVNIGPTSLSASEVNINWARIDDDITIWGVKANGNIGLCLDSTQPSGNFGAGSNYNGSIGGCFIRTVGTAVELNELCAAHTFGDIRHYDIGQYVYHVKGGTDGSSENVFFGGFTHQSAGVTVIKCERALYNEFYGVHAEPGTGSQYYEIDANSIAVRIIGRDNCPDAPTDSSTSSTILVNDTVTIAGSTPYPYTVNIDPLVASVVTHTNWNTLSVDNACLHCGYRLSSGAQNATVSWDVTLSPGTWTMAMVHHQDSNRGIYTVTLDGVSLGTVDGYNGALNRNTQSTIAGFSVTTPGKKRLAFTMATKNGSSSSYFGTLSAIQLFRTA